MHDSIFSYYISEKKASIKGLDKTVEFGKYSIFADSRTPMDIAVLDDRQCIVFGYAVNVINSECDELARKILNKSNSVEDLVEFEKELGGKYIIFLKIEDEYFIQGDATCSIPIFYNVDNDFICSSNFNYILNFKNYEVDCVYGKIRRSGDISQAMPYDITPYKEIKQLLPNHYLKINESERKAIRFINAYSKQEDITVQQATEIVSPRIDILLNYYLQHFKIYCPITGGKDSRVVLAYLMSKGVDVECYTIKHNEYMDNAQDIAIPNQLCKENGLRYKLKKDIELMNYHIEKADDILGKDAYSMRTLQIALNIKSDFGDGAIINGDIIGQVGKCSLHRNIPSIFARPSYFRCKLHNFSNQSKKQLARWLDEINCSRENVNTFDLFSVENRLGRWAGQENLMYNTMGQIYINIFNSRSIIYVWTAVKRSKRMKSLLHLDLINEKQKKLLNNPFENDEGLVGKVLRKNWVFYLLGSYVKYYRDKALFKARGE